MPQRAVVLMSSAPISMTTMWIAIFRRSDIVSPKSRRTDYMPKPPPGRRRVQKPQSASKGAGAFRWPVVLITTGIFLRLGIAVASIGTNDAAAWLRFGDEINQHG